MPWCPKCKNEYREGFKICSDCNVELVDVLSETNDILFCRFTNPEVEAKFRSYLSYSGIKNEQKEDSESTYVSIEQADYEKAAKTLVAFANVEGNMIVKKQIDSSFIVFGKDELEQEFSALVPDEKETAENTEEIAGSENESAEEMRSNLIHSAEGSVYESMQFRADENKGSGYMLIALGVIGIIAMILNTANVITIVQKGFATVVMFIMFGGMIVGGVLSIKRSVRFQEIANEEEQLNNYINKWLKDNITLYDLERVDEPDNTSEENFLLRLDFIKKRLSESVTEFKNLNDNYLDSLIENFYNENF